ncbi:MAG: T9SS type A sorting domain-containing protein, partial [Ferruginibacter sp.]
NSLNLRLVNNPIIYGALNIELFSNTASPIELICTDVTGRVILYRKLQLITGTNYVAIDIRNFAKGIYWIHAVSGAAAGRSNTIKFVK